MKHFFWLLILTSFSLFSQSDFEVAEKWYKAGKYDLSTPLFLELVARNPGDIRSLEYLGDTHSMQKRWENASDYYKKLIGLRAGNPEFHYKYGGALAMDAASGSKWHALSLVPDIRASFEKAIRLDPKHIDAHWALVEYYLQLPGIFGGSESKASHYAEALEKLSAVDGNLAKGRIDEYFKRYAKAEKHFLKAHAIGKSETTRKKLIALYTKMKRPEKIKALSLADVESTRQRTNRSTKP